MAPVAQLRAALPHLIDFALDGLDSDANAPPVAFQFRFTGAAGADAAAKARQRCARADEPWQQVFELRELDLPLAFACFRAARKDVEDELGPVDDFAFESLFELPQLRRGQLVIEDDDIDVG